VLRFSELRKKIQKLLYYAYDIDVYVSLAEVAQEESFCYAEIQEGEENLLEMKNVYHPLVPNAVGNDIRITEESNMVFLTGANMAGKSTFMKTFSIAIYLAHMGFPIPADSMRFSIQNGMFTTINLADNLNMGFSHFYAEVARVKKVAESVNQNDRLVVVFDELFRGTNVKDAYDATVAVADAFASKKKCTFIISSHIIEAGEQLKKMRDNVKFIYLPTIMNDKVPEYTYKISEGITEDRHGMIIIQNEKILDILKA
jgi:DNA mismatch repair ATPase MutS